MWLKGAYDFGAKRFGDAINGPETQQERLATLESAIANDRLDGRRLEHIEFWDTLQARAKLKSGSALGADRITPDVYKQLPFMAVAHVHDMFNEYATASRIDCMSPFWKILEFIGLPKTRMPDTFRF